MSAVLGELARFSRRNTLSAIGGVEAVSSGADTPERAALLNWMIFTGLSAFAAVLLWRYGFIRLTSVRQHSSWPWADVLKFDGQISIVRRHLSVMLPRMLDGILCVISLQRSECREANTN